MPDNPGILQQALDIVLGEAGNPLEVELVKCGAEIFALVEDRSPAETRLESFQAQLLEQATIVGDGKSPFRVVIGEKLGRGPGPRASGPPVRTFENLAPPTGAAASPDPPPLFHQRLAGRQSAHLAERLSVQLDVELLVLADQTGELLAREGHVLDVGVPIHRVCPAGRVKRLSLATSAG